MVEAPLQFIRPREPKPEWLKVRAPGRRTTSGSRASCATSSCNTVCEDAHCPNIGECWHHGTATFMILGDVCTRACAYCAVAHGKPQALDTDEPVRVAEAVQAMAPEVRRDHLGGPRRPGGRRRVDLRRHDPRDQGARARLPRRGADPGLQGRGGAAADRARRAARHPEPQHRDRAAPLPDGAVGRKYTRTPGAARARAPHTRRRSRPRPASWWASARSRTSWSRCSRTCARSAWRSSRSASTCGRRADHAPMTRYYHPDEFAELKRIALGLGFVHVEAGPLVRSSYHAHEQADAAAPRWPAEPGPGTCDRIRAFPADVPARCPLTRLRRAAVDARPGVWTGYAAGCGPARRGVCRGGQPWRRADGPVRLCRRCRDIFGTRRRPSRRSRCDAEPGAGPRESPGRHRSRRGRACAHRHCRRRGGRHAREVRPGSAASACRAGS